MVMLFRCDEVLKNVGVCSESTAADVFCFNKPESSSLTTKLLDNFYKSYYRFSLNSGEEYIAGSGGTIYRFNKNAIIWRLGTPRTLSQEELLSGIPKLGGSGPEYMLKCEQSGERSACQYWKPGKTYPDPALSQSKTTSSSQSPSEAMSWYPYADTKISDSASFTEPDAEFVYELNHSPCLETISKNKQIIEESSDCVNLPLFEKFLSETAPEPTTPSGPQTPPSGPPSSSIHSEPSYLQAGIGIAGALISGYKTYQEASKYFQGKDKKPNEEAFSSKRFTAYATATAVSLGLTIYSLKA